MNVEYVFFSTFAVVAFAVIFSFLVEAIFLYLFKQKVKCYGNSEGNDLQIETLPPKKIKFFCILADVLVCP